MLAPVVCAAHILVRSERQDRGLGFMSIHLFLRLTYDKAPRFGCVEQKFSRLKVLSGAWRPVPIDQYQLSAGRPSVCYDTKCQLIDFQTQAVLNL